MNWSKLQTYGESSEKAFESLCNQLFENWCKNEYKDFVASFYVVNGAGGDGGVESYAVLNNGDIVALQAKWFLNTIDSSKISQIKNSIKTALSVRPEIKRYIVCVPRNLANKTAKGENSEQSRWDALINSFANYPDLVIELWNEQTILGELQKASSIGINRYWFGDGKILYEAFTNAFEKSKISWLSNRYIPDINTPGHINIKLLRFICDGQEKLQLLQRFIEIKDAIDAFKKAFHSFISLFNNSGANTEVITTLKDMQSKMQVLSEQSDSIIAWLQNENSILNCVNEFIFNIDFDSPLELLKRTSFSSKHYFHYREIIRPLEKLNGIDFYQLHSMLSDFLDKKPLIFKGNPGTGKTCGVAAFVEQLLSEKYHLPILIQAREVDEKKTWKEIVIDNLGLSQNWDEDELWQALMSLANLNKVSALEQDRKIKSLPKVIIIVDGVDESVTPEKWEIRVKESIVISKKYPTIEFCFLTRPHLFQGAENYAQIKYLGHDGDVAMNVLFPQYLKHYNIKIENEGTIKYLLTTPLSLKLFCELYKNQSIVESTQLDFSLPELLSQKIDCIEKEFASKEKVDLKDQFVLKTIKLLTQLFLKEPSIEREFLLKKMMDSINTTRDLSCKILDYLNKYGILYSLPHKSTGVFSVIEYYYSPGIRGFFDYTEAVMILEECRNPWEIDFNKYNHIGHNTLYVLAILCIRKYNYLITSNSTMDVLIKGSFIDDLAFFALRHSTKESAITFRKGLIKIMGSSAYALIDVVNKIILPLSRVSNHPLGVSILDEYLSSFKKPAQRDLMWSPIGYLNNDYGQRWSRYETLELLENEEYALNEDDTCNGCPTIYAWALSSLNNTLRMNYRDCLMGWALKNPNEFYELFLKFADVNDPQIRSDIYSILMCLIYETESKELTEKAFCWLRENVLSPKKIDFNRSIAIRYYAIAIIHKAIELSICTNLDAIPLLPPYAINTNQILLNKNALKGDRMSGYSGITYDLSRYVLVDHFDNILGYKQTREKKVNDLLNGINVSNPEFSGIDFEHFILSSAYAYVLDMGWCENDFNNY